MSSITDRLSKVAASRRPARWAAGSIVVPLRAGVGPAAATHMPGPESAAGPGTFPSNRLEAHRVIHSALLAAGWQPAEARAIVMTADIELAARVASDTLTLHARTENLLGSGVDMAGVS